MRKTTSSFGGSSSSTYVSDNCNYQNSAYKGAVASSVSAAEIGLSTFCSVAMNPACIATSAFITAGSGFSDTLDSQNLCTDYTMAALNDISSKLTEIQETLSNIRTSLNIDSLKSKYSDAVDDINDAAERYQTAVNKSEIKNGQVDIGQHYTGLWYSHVLGQDNYLYNDLEDIKQMIETGTEFLSTSGNEGIYTSYFDQYEFCNPTIFEYINNLLVEGYTHYMMAKQVEYNETNKAIEAAWIIESVQEDMADALMTNKEYYYVLCPCLVTDARAPYCGKNIFLKNSKTKTFFLSRLDGRFSLSGFKIQ